jgi:hypothetical protein
LLAVEGDALDGAGEAFAGGGVVGGRWHPGIVAPGCRREVGGRDRYQSGPVGIGDQLPTPS